MYVVVVNIEAIIVEPHAESLFLKWCSVLFSNSCKSQLCCGAYLPQFWPEFSDYVTPAMCVLGSKVMIATYMYNTKSSSQQTSTATYQKLPQAQVEGVQGRQGPKERV